MYTSLRGHGSYKRDLLTALLNAYGCREFRVRDVADLPGFSPGIFRRLVLDGLLVPSSGASPHRWRITSAVVAAADGRAMLDDVRGAGTRVFDGCP